MRALSLVAVIGVVLVPAIVAAQATERFDPNEAHALSPGEKGQPFSPSSLLWDNGPIVTCAGCGAGGADESRLQTSSLGMSILGFAHQVDGGNRIADEFEVTEPLGWDIEAIHFWAYQSLSSTTSTMTAVNLRIWDGVPGGGGSVVWGDTTTNLLTKTVWSNIYRTSEESIGSTVRPIMLNTLALAAPLHLDAGTYWLDWQADGVDALTGPFAPPLTILGQCVTGNGMQLIGGAWGPAVDDGSACTQGFPFIIEGTPSVPETLACDSPRVTFKSGIPAAWTVVSGPGPVYWSTTDDLVACDNGGNRTLGSGKAACADSDQTNTGGVPYETEMFSNSFSLMYGYVHASLRFAGAYKDIGSSDLFEVWVWEGGVGTLELQWNENHNEILSLDLAPYLGVQDLKVSFRYHGQNWDWWAQVDDVSLSCPDIFADGFESGDTSAW